MKAIEFSQYGTPDMLRVVDLPRPTPKHDQVLIRVHASSINSWDWELLNGIPFINRLLFGLFRPKPTKRVLGADVAGTVEEVGSRVTRFRPGDRVFGDLWDNWGGFAEFACIDETSIEPIPSNSTFLEAAAVPQAGVLALQGLRKGEPLSSGQKVLINGAGGGVGTFAIQLAKLRGAEVTGVDASHKLDAIRDAGADYAIDYAETDFTRTGERYDLIVDCQNFRPMRDNKRALKPTGTYAMIGGSMSRAYELWLLSFLSRFTREKRKLYLVAEGPNKGLTELCELMQSGKLVSVIDQIFPLAEVPTAMRYFGEGRHRGKILINVRSE
jgi:NADPH:quinone reductase-like Zn-dependent oxidoreductase